jgi:hypothetical protein
METQTTRRGRSERGAGRLIVLLAAVLGVLAFATAIGSAQTDPGDVSAGALAPTVFTPSSQASFTLSACRLPDKNHDGIPDYYLPTANGFVCDNADYTTGNLGKMWNELDLVPHRLTTTLGNQSGATTDYSVIVAADNTTAGKAGYDLLSVPIVNTALSDNSCKITSVGPESIATGVTGGADNVMYRQVDIHQAVGTTCVLDYYQRLALGSHLYPGSSLQSYMFQSNDFKTGKKTLSIPVNEIAPQSLAKDMTATRGSDHVWDVTKGATPAQLAFSNTCDANQSLKNDGVQIKVTWTKEAATPSGPATIVTHVYATNPAARTVTIDNLTDVIYAGTNQSSVLDTNTDTTGIDLAPNTTQPVMTHTYVWNDPGTAANDVVTATYTDKVTLIPIPGTTTASASATVQNNGPELNPTAMVNDVESITGTGLSYSADSFSPAIGGFDNGYTAGTQTTGSVSWTGASLGNSGSVTFDKTVYATKGTIVSNGNLHDEATLTGSDGASASAKADIPITVDSKATLTITKTIPNVLQGSETATFQFHVTNSSNVEVAAPTVTFAAGQTSKDVTVPNLAFGSYTVSEDTATGWNDQNSKTVSLTGCAVAVEFDNQNAPAVAQVRKVTVPTNHESGWQMTLNGPGTPAGGETVETTGTGYVPFTTSLQEGSYTVTETGQDHWLQTGTSADCSFTVNYPADNGKTFSCTITNTTAYPSIATEASPTTGTVGQALTVGDTATLSDGIDPTGSVHFALYSDDQCTVPVAGVAGDGTISSGSASFSTLWTPTAVGTYYWIASYAGDGENQPFTTTCGDANEQIVIGKATPDLVTNASGPVTIGDKIHDVATLSGGYPTLTGTVSFQVFAPGDTTCSTPIAVTPDQTVSGTGDYTSADYTTSKVGDYRWIAHYTGDTNNKAVDTACNDANETSTVGKATPDLVTNASGPVTIGDKIHDVATLSGGYPTLTGTVSFQVFAPGDTTCSTPIAVTPDQTVSGTGDYTSADYTTSKVGDYRWIAHYTGDTNNKAVDTACNDANETSTVQKMSPSILTSATDATGASTSISDSATLSDGHNPTGSITFKLYGPSSTPSCTGAVLFTSTVSVNGNGTYGPVSFSPATAGTYYWIASYGGDGSNAAVTGTCGDTGETSTVSPGKAKVVKTVSGQPPSGTQAFSFQLRQGASMTSDGTTLEQVDANSANSGTINFATSLVPGSHYQLCEWVLPGWNTSLGPNLFVPNSIIPPALPNANVNNMTVCTDFVAQADQTTTFSVDNTPPPGGRALTIGFWKNWASCSNSNGNGQKPMLDQTLAAATNMVTNPPGGLVVSAQNPGGGWANFAATYYLVLKGSSTNLNVAPDCSNAVNLLNKSTIDGKKKASDPLFNMTAQLVGAQLNYFAGAGKNGPTTLNIQTAVLLAGKYQFNGLTYNPKLTAADTTRTNCLATQLDNYNNDRTVTACP